MTYPSDEEQLQAVLKIVHADEVAVINGEPRSAAVVLMGIREAVGTLLLPPPPECGAITHCVLCLNGVQGSVRATVVVDGYSFCETHSQQVIDHGPGIFFTTDDRFALRATVLNMRAGKRRAESL